MRVVQKVLTFTQKELEKQDSFSQFFNIVSLDINALGPTMPKHCNPITEEGGVLAVQKPIQIFPVL